MNASRTRILISAKAAHASALPGRTRKQLGRNFLGRSLGIIYHEFIESLKIRRNRSLERSIDSF